MDLILAKNVVVIYVESWNKNADNAQSVFEFVRMGDLQVHPMRAHTKTC